jgi:hypothetical protein
LFSQSANYRGKVIDAAIFLEMDLAQILSKYFTEPDAEKKKLLIFFIFDRMPLNQSSNF